YRDEEAYRFAFARFINLVPRSGMLVAGWESPIVRELAAKSFAPVASFGIQEADSGEVPAAAAVSGSDHPGSAAGADATQLAWTARDVRYGEDMTRFVVLHQGQVWGDVETPLAGAHNVRNCLAAIAAAHAVGAEPAKVQEALRTF